MIKQKIAGSLLALSLAAGLFNSTYTVSASEPAESVYAIVPETSKASSRSIRLSWKSSDDAAVKYYYVMRRGTKDSKGTGTWKTLARIKSDGKAGGPANSYTDKLKSSSPQQYEYKICTLSKNAAVDTRNQEYQDETDQYAVLGSNIKVCIDPGHYGNRNNNYDQKGKNGEHPYSEAQFVLKIGKALQEELKQEYGIDSYMTRTTSRISLTYNGKTYANEKLDMGSISVRGYMAKTKECDFFISLHTNATGRKKNPWNQPKKLNKVYIFVNSTAHKSSRGMKIANSIGTELTAINQESGIQSAGFEARSRKKAANFTNLKNDSYSENGTVIYRKGSSGSDYYGVLRGASAKGVEGIIVEHAYHATGIVREQANVSSDLCENWAECDAYGIARGFGFATSNRS